MLKPTTLESTCAALALLLIAGCSEPPTGSHDDFADASSDGFLDVPPPPGVDFDETTNLSLELINEVTRADLVAVARAEGVPDEYLALLPLVSVVATVDLTFHYANATTNSFSESAAIEPFEKAYEFACPQRLDVALVVDVFSPFGNLESLFSDTSVVLQRGTDFACGDALVIRAYVDAQGAVHFEETGD